MYILNSLLGAPKGSSIFSNLIWASCTFMSYGRQFQKSKIDIYFFVCILVFACIYIQLPLASTRWKLQEGALFLGKGILGPYIFMCSDKKFQKSTTNICFVVCILVFAPQVFIELPLGSSNWELHF